MTRLLSIRVADSEFVKEEFEIVLGLFGVNLKMQL